MSLIAVFNVPFEDYELLNDPKSRSHFFEEKKKIFSWSELRRLLIVKKQWKDANDTMQRNISLRLWA